MVRIPELLLEALRVSEGGVGVVHRNQEAVRHLRRTSEALLDSAPEFASSYAGLEGEIHAMIKVDLRMGMQCLDHYIIDAMTHAYYQRDDTITIFQMRYQCNDHHLVRPVWNRPGENLPKNQDDNDPE